MRKIIRNLTLGLAIVAGLTLVGAPSAMAVDQTIPTPYYTQIDECGTTNDKFVFNANGAPAGSVAGFVTYAAPSYNGTDGYNARVSARTGYVFEGGVKTVRTSLPAFTNEPC